MPHTCSWHGGTIKWKKWDSIPLKLSQPHSMSNEILNFYNNRSSDVMAESFNAKFKLFRANVRGGMDKKFFLFRIANLYAYPTKNLLNPYFQKKRACGNKPSLRFFRVNLRNKTTEAVPRMDTAPLSFSASRKNHLRRPSAFTIARYLSMSRSCR